MKLRKILVCGGREYSNFVRLYDVLCRLQEVTGFSVLVHGAARGADRMAGFWAGGRVVEVRAYPADWTRHGKGAGPIRNREMAHQEHPDATVVFPGGNGTEDMVRVSRVNGIAVLRA